ncbi:WhiB family transcriptional regulator [Kibdelosporangium aridum]|uniref:WhiB family transcriptional regulator n=1 Tax=Kibdelosporangium aridum TaxID=2030 RepID=UPI000524A7B6
MRRRADIERLPHPVAEAWAWQLHGACRGEDIELFFHPDGECGRARAERDAAAIAVCHRCPVLDRCRQHALSTREPEGVWGGMNAKERARFLEREDLVRVRAAQFRSAARLSTREIIDQLP